MPEIQFEELPGAPAVVLERAAAGWQVKGGDTTYEVLPIDAQSVQLNIGGKNHQARILRSDDSGTTIEVDGIPIKTRVVTERDRLLARMGHSAHSSSRQTDLKSPMPGLVLKILVKAGDGVTKGDPLLILESMKMENVLKAGQNGVIAEIGIKEGDSVEKSHVLLRYR